MTVLAARQATGSWGESHKANAENEALVLLRSEVAVPVGGLPVGGPAWAPVAGATGVEVDHAGIRVGPALFTTVMQVVTATPSVNAVVLAIPDGFLVSRLHLGGLKVGTTALVEASDLNEGRRLVVALPAAQGGGFGPPVHSVPSVPARGALPATLTGAAFSHGVLQFPGVAASTLRVSVTSGATPDVFQELGAAFGTVTADLVPVGRDLVVKDATGATAWSHAGPLADTVDADLTATAERLLAGALPKGAPLQAGFTLSARAATTVGLSTSAPRGRLLRVVPGTVKVVLEGDPVALDLGPGAAALAAERPATASALVSFHYAGVRLSETVDDALPPGEVRGVVVAGEAVLRPLPPQGLVGVDVARIGVIGLAPVAATLSAQLVDTGTGRPLGPPAVTEVAAPSGRRPPGTVWLTLPAPQRPTGPVAVALSATSGRFLWATAASSTSAEALPLLRLAVADPDPGGRPVMLAGGELAKLPLPAAGPGLPLATSLPVAAFTGPATPVLESALFVTVELSTLTLRYSR